ncbi:MAG: hypothetical protein H7Z73_12310 [Candidatus Saccharibacteria bacterium]|nr:hypothetical protein [Moraxellaceae bacterium]
MSDRQWCCKSQNIMVSDNEQHGEPTMINRVCLNCYTHFYGLVGEVKTYTRKEWDDYLDRNLKNLEKEIFA